MKRSKRAKLGKILLDASIILALVSGAAYAMTQADFGNTIEQASR